MQNPFSGVQARSLPGSTGRRIGRCLGLFGFLAAGVLVAGQTLSVPASAQPAAPRLKQNPTAEEQKLGSIPRTQEGWREVMSRKPPPHKGCFTAAYPKLEWAEVQCGGTSGGLHLPALGNAPGNNNTEIAIGTGSLSEAIGSFDIVSGAASVTDSNSLKADAFSLQLNTNFFQVTLCTNSSNCGWQQFVFESYGCPDQNGQPTDCVQIIYWLRDWTNCPMGWGTFVDAARTHCAVQTQGTLTPHEPITSLKKLRLTGRFYVTDDTDPTKNMVGAIFDDGQMLYMNAGPDLLAMTGLNHVWQEAEFNVFGQENGSQAQFSSPTTLLVRTQIDDQAGNIFPACIQFGFTRESNNLHVIQPPTITKAQFPSIAFQESTNSPMQPVNCAASVGDTHLMTFDGLFYDFQASGEFLLAQPAPDFIVQTQQVSGAPNWPNAAINKAVGVKMGKTQVAICLAPDRLEIDGKRARLDKGKSLSLPGGVSLFRRGDTYFIWRPGGDVVRADVNNNEYIDVYVGHAPGAKVGGLLGNANGPTSDDIAIQAGSTLTQPISFTDLYGRYADSWRIAPNQSLLCPGHKIESGKPVAPIYATDLTQSQNSFAQGVCAAAGVKDPTLLEACILDVTVIGSNSAANVFASLTPPVAVMRVAVGASLPTSGVQPPPGIGTPSQITK
jgi:hypothetical protein